MYDFSSIKLLYFILIFCSINKVKILYCHAINYNLCFTCFNLCFTCVSVVRMMEHVNLASSSVSIFVSVLINTGSPS